RRGRSLELGDDGVVPRHLPGDGMVDLQDRLSTQELVVDGSIEPSGHPQAAALMDERKAQPVKWASTEANTAYIAMPSTARPSRQAKTSGIWKFDPACTIR